MTDNWIKFLILWISSYANYLLFFTILMLKTLNLAVEEQTPMTSFL